MTQVRMMWWVSCELSHSEYHSLGKFSFVIMKSELKFPGVCAKWSESLLGQCIQKVLNTYS